VVLSGRSAIAGSLQGGSCLQTVHLVLHLSSLGFFIHWKKICPLPSHTIIYLGVELNSASMRAQFPRQRVEKLTALLRRVTSRSVVTALSVIQLLSMTSAGHVVIPLGLPHRRRLQRWFACASTLCVRGKCAGAALRFGEYSSTSPRCCTIKHVLICTDNRPRQPTSIAREEYDLRSFWTQPGGCCSGRAHTLLSIRAMYIPGKLNRGARRAQDHPTLGVDAFAHRPWPRVLLYGFPTSSADPSVPGPSAGEAAISGPDSPGAHGSVLVSMPTAYAVRQTVRNSVARGRSLPGGGSDQQPPSCFIRGVQRLRPVSRTLADVSKAPFEPLDQVPLKLLSAKVVGYYFWLYQRKG